MVSSSITKVKDWGWFYFSQQTVTTPTDQNPSQAGEEGRQSFGLGLGLVLVFGVAVASLGLTEIAKKNRNLLFQDFPVISFCNFAVFLRADGPVRMGIKCWVAIDEPRRKKNSRLQ